MTDKRGAAEEQHSDAERPPTRPADQETRRHLATSTHFGLAKTSSTPQRVEAPVAFPEPVSPMLAKAVTRLPDEPGYLFEPKWDGFRVIVTKVGGSIELTSRGAKSLNRYFPEVLEALGRTLPNGVRLDGELVVATGAAGAQRLDWDALSARIHPADSRVRLLSERTPASFIAFDLLAASSQSLTHLPFSARRTQLEELCATLPAGESLHLTRTTDDLGEAQRWFEEFEGAGLDGVIAKRLDDVYEPNKRIMLKLKHKRTAEAVLLGYRVHKSGNGVGSLLLGMYDSGGELRNVGGISAFTATRRMELLDELKPLIERGDDGGIALAQTQRSRFSSSKDVSYVPLRPERVVEVAFDQLESERFRHAVTFIRWRPDREPATCLLEQVDRAKDYDLGKVLI